MTERKPWWFGWSATWAAILGLILVALALRLIVLWTSPFTLVEDEAHYWEWSRHLAWSYYSKGPGVAWSIASSTALLGTSEFAVRVPAAIAVALGMLAAAMLGRDVTGSKQIAFVAAVLYVCMPAFQMTGLLMTIDGPYFACWTWALWAAHRALRMGKGSAWLAFGGFVALGFIFKYTILLLVLGVLLAILVDRKSLTLHKKWKTLALAGIGIAMLGLVPVVLWNSQHDWATFRHLLGHLGAKGGDVPEQVNPNATNPYSPIWTLEFIGATIGLAGPTALLVLWSALNARKHAEPAVRSAMRFCIMTGLPIMVFYLFVTFASDAEGNWALGAFASWCVPAAWATVDGVRRNDRAVRATWSAALFLGLGLLIMFPIAPTLAKVGKMGEIIPVRRFTGMREVAAETERLMDQLREQTGKEPFIVSKHYGRASQLAFYLPGHPTLYCASTYARGRKTQYDVWAHTDLRRDEVRDSLLGRPALLTGGEAWLWERGFDSIQDLGPLAGEPEERRTAWFGFGYNGLRDYDRALDGPRPWERELEDSTP